MSQEIPQLTFTKITFKIIFKCPRGRWVNSSPLVPRICVRTLGEHWFGWWVVAHVAPNHYLNQSLLIVNWSLRNKLQWNCNQNSTIFIQENVFENTVCEMTAILSRWRWVILSFLHYWSSVCRWYQLCGFPVQKFSLDHPFVVRPSSQQNFTNIN